MSKQETQAANKAADNQNPDTAVVNAENADQGSEAKVAQLEAEIADLKNQNADLQSKVSAGSNEQYLNDRIATLEEDNKKLASQVEEITLASTEEISRLSAELSGAQKDAKEGRVTASLNGKKYQITGKRFTYKGREITPEILQNEEKLLKELVDLKVGFITEVKED